MIQGRIREIELITNPEISGEYTESSIDRTLVINTMIKKINEQSEYINAIVTGFENEIDRLEYLDVPKAVMDRIVFQLSTLQTVLKPLRNLQLDRNDDKK